MLRPGRAQKASETPVDASASSESAFSARSKLRLFSDASVPFCRRGHSALALDFPWLAFRSLTVVGLRRRLTFDMRGLTRLAGASPLDGRVRHHCHRRHRLPGSTELFRPQGSVICLLTHS